MKKQPTPPQPARRGARLQDGAAHAADHGRFSRRSFLRTLGAVGAGSLVLNHLPVNALGASPLTAAVASADSDRVLVFIRLKGGNDGLNTLIPVHDFGTYQSLRPEVHIPRNEAVAFTPTLATHPQLAPLRSLWNEGRMRVVQNVGYPEQNLSHFRSSDIWATTSDSEEVINSGVLGRYLDHQFPDFLTDPPTVPPAIQIGGPGNLLFNNADDFNYAISTENPTELYNIARTGQLYDVEAVPECTYGEQLSYIRAVANTTFRYSGVLAEAFDAGANANDAGYRDDRLADQLALIARLLRGGLETRLFVVEIDGFDTHANQVEAHAGLLQSLAENTTAFFRDLAAGGQAERVLAMTFSEFGRRIEQNGSRGTDHGAAAPLMLFGHGLNGNGLIGGLPNLTDTDRSGNLRHSVDFRAIYATVLSRWLCIDNDLVDEMMGASFDRLDGLGLACSSVTSTTDIGRPASVGLRAYLSGGDVVLDYDLPAAGPASVRFFDAVGRQVGSPYRGRRPAGPQQQRFDLATINFAAGVHVVSLETGGRVYSQQIALFR